MRKYQELRDQIDPERRARTDARVAETLATMPEPIDFEQIASEHVPPQYVGFIIEALRHVWNARGAADAKAVEDRLSTLTGWVTSEPYRQHLDEAIRKQDR